MPLLSSPPRGLTYKTFDAVDAGFVIEPKAGAGPRTKRFLISSDTLDRDNEVVLPRGMNVAEYMRNPVFIWAHKYDQLPVGRCLEIEMIENGRALAATFEFATHKFADELYQLYRDDFTRAVSVGFRALAAAPPTQEQLAARPELTRCYRVISVSKLFEVSAVPIPSNPDALAEATAKGLRVPAMTAALCRSGLCERSLRRLSNDEAVALAALVTKSGRARKPADDQPRDHQGNPRRVQADDDDDEDINAIKPEDAENKDKDDVGSRLARVEAIVNELRRRDFGKQISTAVMSSFQKFLNKHK